MSETLAAVPAAVVYSARVAEAALCFNKNRGFLNSTPPVCLSWRVSLKKAEGENRGPSIILQDFGGKESPLPRLPLQELYPTELRSSKTAALKLEHRLLGPTLEFLTH